MTLKELFGSFSYEDWHTDDGNNRTSYIDITFKKDVFGIKQGTKFEQGSCNHADLKLEFYNDDNWKNPIIINFGGFHND